MSKQAVEVKTMDREKMTRAQLLEYVDQLHQAHAKTKHELHLLKEQSDKDTYNLKALQTKYDRLLSRSHNLVGRVERQHKIMLKTMKKLAQPEL